MLPATCAEHTLKASLGISLAGALICGAAGPRWSREEVQGLLADAEQALNLCKPWLAQNYLAAQKKRLREQKQEFAELAARRPGESTLPAIDSVYMTAPPPPVLVCSGCGQLSTSLKKCSRCRAVAYCSRACHARHWKEGGHKQQCAQLVAGAGPSSGSS